MIRTGLLQHFVPRNDGILTFKIEQVYTHSIFKMKFVIHMRQRNPAIYIMTNKRNGTLYTGVTSNLIKRVQEHKYDNFRGFTKRYGCELLVYYELCENMYSAIEREKQIKGGSRKKKLTLIENMNPNWQDLYDDLI
jgi:putative endonuclease